MKRAQRLPYLALTEIYIQGRFAGNLGLCHLCRFAEWSGSCSDSELKCIHPLRQDDDVILNTWEGYGSDCWTFRPAYSMEDTADMVGALMQTGWWPNMSKCKLKAAGVSEKCP